MNLLNGTEMLEVNFYLLVFIPSERSSVSDNRNELLKLELQGSILQNSIPAETVRIKFWKKLLPNASDIHLSVNYGQLILVLWYFKAIYVRPNLKLTV
jgi:hypothetical protein